MAEEAPSAVDFPLSPSIHLYVKYSVSASGEHLFGAPVNASANSGSGGSVSSSTSLLLYNAAHFCMRFTHELWFLRVLNACLCFWTPSFFCCRKSPNSMTTFPDLVLSCRAEALLAFVDQMVGFLLMMPAQTETEYSR